MESYPNKPGDGQHEPRRKVDDYGHYEAHSCIRGCELTIWVCALCGGDYHEDHPNKDKCLLKK